MIISLLKFKTLVGLFSLFDYSTHQTYNFKNSFQSTSKSFLLTFLFFSLWGSCWASLSSSFLRNPLIPFFFPLYCDHFKAFSFISTFFIGSNLFTSFFFLTFDFWLLIWSLVFPKPSIRIQSQSYTFELLLRMNLLIKLFYFNFSSSLLFVITTASRFSILGRRCRFVGQSFFIFIFYFFEIWYSLNLQELMRCVCWVCGLESGA